MDNAESFAQVKGTIEAFPLDKTRSPSRPLRDFISTAEYALGLALKKKDVLRRAKFDYSKVDDLKMYIGSFRHLSSAWQDVQFDNPESSQIWKAKQAEAEVVFFELIEALRLAFYDDENMQNKIRVILEGGSIADSIQDLNDTVYLTDQNRDKIFEETELTQEIIDKAATLASELGQLYASVKIDRSSSQDALILRNKTYTLIEDIMDEIERRGKYAYRNDPKSSVLFSFAYRPIKRRKKEEKKPVEIVAG